MYIDFLPETKHVREILDAADEAGLDLDAVQRYQRGSMVSFGREGAYSMAVVFDKRGQLVQASGRKPTGGNWHVVRNERRGTELTAAQALRVLVDTVIPEYAEA